MIGNSCSNACLTCPACYCCCCWMIDVCVSVCRTIAKVSVSGSGFMSELLQDIDSQSLPGKKPSLLHITRCRSSSIDRSMLSSSPSLPSPYLVAMVGGEYKGFVDYEAFAFDLEYLNADTTGGVSAVAVVAEPMMMMTEPIAIVAEPPCLDPLR